MTDTARPTAGPVMLSRNSYGYDLCCSNNGRYAGWFVELHHGGRQDDTPEFYAEFDANANLIAEAFNVHHETQMTPRQLADRVRELEGALRKAETFISNGIEFGVIRMPDSNTADSAHETLPAIRAALAGKEPGK